MHGLCPADLSRELARHRSVPARPTAQAAGLLPEQEAALLQQLAAADRQWLPRAETLPSGAVRYHYHRRANEAPGLTVDVKRFPGAPVLAAIAERMLKRADCMLWLARVTESEGKFRWDFNLPASDAFPGVSAFPGAVENLADALGALLDELASQ